MISKDRINSTESAVYIFGEFQLETENLLLQKNSEVVPLAPKTLEVLLTLIEANGKLITKQEILDKVWENTYVEEANLTHHISALRKALCDDKNGRKFIETIPRRGYRFVAEVAGKTELKDFQNLSTEIVFSERTTTLVTEEIEIEHGENEKIVSSPMKQITGQPDKSSRNKLLIISFAGVLLLLLSGLTFYIFVVLRGEKDARSASVEPLNYLRVSNGKSVGATTISPDGKFVAYIQNYSDAGGGSLYLRQLETNREIQLLEPEARTFGNIDFSPDSSLIYYASFEKNAKAAAIYSISILGGKPKRLFDLDWASAYFAVSPDGKRIAFYRSDEASQTTSLIVAPSDGASGDEQILHTHPNAEPSFWGWLAWSPDNSFLVVSKVSTSDTQWDAKLFRLDPQTGETDALTDETFAVIGKMCFRPDGRELFFIAREDNFVQRIYALDLASRKVRRVVNDEISYGNYGLGITADGKSLAADLLETKANLWSIEANGKTADARRIKNGEHDGKRGIAGFSDNSIAYISRIGDKSDIWTVNADGSNPQMITNDRFQEKDLTASRDGRFLIFSSDRTNNEGKSGSRHLFRMNPDGSDLRQLTFGETIDIQPDCSPDNKRIVYLSEENGSSFIKEISIEGGTPVALTDYFMANPTFSPDGKHIAGKFMSASRSQPGEIVIISASGGKPEKTFPITDFEFFNVSTPIRWTSDGTGLIFRREQNGAGNLWRQDVNSATPPRQLTDFSIDTIYNFNYSLDGKRILISRGSYQNNAVIIQNF